MARERIGQPIWQRASQPVMLSRSSNPGRILVNPPISRAVEVPYARRFDKVYTQGLARLRQANREATAVHRFFTQLGQYNVRDLTEHFRQLMGKMPHLR